MKLFLTGLLLVNMFAFVGCQKYEALVNMSKETHLLTEEQRSQTVLTDFVIMEAGRATDYNGLTRVYTEEDLHMLVESQSYAPAMLGHVAHLDVAFGWFENFRVEDGMLIADLVLEPIDEYNEMLADGVRVLYYIYPHRAELSAGLNGDRDDLMIMEVSFVQKGAAVNGLRK